MEQISSTNNQKVKDWKKLKRRKNREKQNSYLIEGFHLVEEALKHQSEGVIHILIREDLLNDESVRRLRFPAQRIISISSEVAEEISETETNQGIFALMAMIENENLKKIERPILVLDAVQDPGNVGTMIRTADAAGFQGVFLGKGTVDLYNSKTIRSAQGSHFHIDVFSGEIETLIQTFKEKNLPVYGTALNDAAVSYKELDAKAPFALIVGNEGAGVNSKFLEGTDQNIYIPIKGEAESLNVAIAASILMFHLY